MKTLLIIISILVLVWVVYGYLSSRLKEIKDSIDQVFKKYLIKK